MTGMGARPVSRDGHTEGKRTLALYEKELSHPSVHCLCICSILMNSCMKQNPNPGGHWLLALTQAMLFRARAAVPLQLDQCQTLQDIQIICSQVQRSCCVSGSCKY